MNAPYFSFAQRRKLKLQQSRQQAAQAEEQKAQSAPELDSSVSDYSAFEQLKFSLDKDVQWLKDKGKGEEKRTAIKEIMIPRYMPHLESYAAQDDVYANPILVQLVIWLFDAGEIEQAYQYGMLAIDQQQQLPKLFKRDLPTFMTDSIKVYAQQAKQKADKAKAHYFLLKAVDGVRQWPVNDDAKMNYLTTLGDSFDQRGGKDNQTKALALFLEAQQYGNAKRKTRIRQLTQLLGSPPPEGTLVSMTEDRGLPGQDIQGSPSTSNAEEATVINTNESAEESR